MSEKSKNSNKLLLSVVVCILPIAVSIIFYNKLPDKIPQNFNIGGEIIYTSKFTYAFIQPGIFLIGDIISVIIASLKTKISAKAFVFSFIIPCVSLLLGGEMIYYLLK